MGLLEDVRDRITSDAALIQYYGTDSGQSPEEILLEKERRETIVNLMKRVMKVLGKRDRKVLWLYIKGYTQSDIGNHIGITQQAVEKRLKNIPKKLRKKLSQHYLTLTKAYLLDNPSVKEAGTPREYLGWPCSFSQKIAVEGTWKYLNGYKRWKTQTECRMLQYLPKNTSCCFCGIKCKYPEENPMYERKENPMEPT